MHNVWKLKVIFFYRVPFSGFLTIFFFFIVEQFSQPKQVLEILKELRVFFPILSRINVQLQIFQTMRHHLMYHYFIFLRLIREKIIRQAAYSVSKWSDIIFSFVKVAMSKKKYLGCYLVVQRYQERNGRLVRKSLATDFFNSYATKCPKCLLIPAIHSIPTF